MRWMFSARVGWLQGRCPSAVARPDQMLRLLEQQDQLSGTGMAKKEMCGWAGSRPMPVTDQA